MKTHKVRNSLLLLLTALIWGTAFVAQSVGMDYVGPFTYSCVRSLIAGIMLIPCIAFLNKVNPNQEEKEICRDESRRKAYQKKLLIGGICCGLALGVASCLQQIGIQHTTVGKAGFITTFYIIIVPIIGLFFKKRCGLNVWAGVVLALAGLYFLCITEGFSIGYGDTMVFLCALAFSIHILVIDHFTELVDGVKMSCIQFFCGRYCKRCGDARDGTAGYSQYSGGMAADSLCRSSLKRCWIHSPDYRTKGDESDHRVADFKSGVGDFCFGRYGDSG